MHRLRRLLPLIILLAALGIVWGTGLGDSISWAGLAHNQAALLDWVSGHPLAAPAIYAAFYAAVVALSVPAAAVITTAGGLLFGSLFGGALAVLGATAGATILFLAARSAFAESLARRGGKLLATIRIRLRHDGFLYLLAIRLVPVFPFWMVNLAAALGGMRLAPYALATLIGMMPVTFVLASIGSGIGGVLAAGGQPDLSVLFAPRILGPLIALAGLSLLPLVLRRLKRTDA